MKLGTRPSAAARGAIVRRARWLSGAVGLAFGISATLLGVAPSASAVPAAPKAPAASYQTISGAGSTWAQNAINAWVSDVAQNGLQVNYAGVGSTTGRNDFKQGTVNFAASEIPYGVVDGTNSDPPPNRGYVYMPDVAGGTTFMYNLKIGTQRVTDLRLSGKTISDIFTGQIQYWDDNEIKTDNPALALPHIQIIPVVRSDGSGATADFTQWMLATQPSDWQHYCSLVGRSPCTQTSAYPVWSGDPAMVGQQGDTGVSGYVSQNGANGAIGYVEFSYAIQAGFPVAKVLNAAGYYTEPTPGHVAVSLLAAKINSNSGSANYLTEDLSGVYTNTDPRTYELSAYSYFVLPTDQAFPITANQGYSLGAFGSYLLCQGQQQVDNLGYSALPINLVQAGYTQLQKIPGAQIPSTSGSFIQGCNNPTFSPDGTNKLANTDPQPAACDHQGNTQCTTATGGAPGSGGATGAPGSTSSSPAGGGNGVGGNGTGGNGTGGSTGTGSSVSPGSSTNTGSNTGAGSSAGAGSSSGAGVTAPSCDPNTGVCSTAGSNVTSQNGGSGTGAQAGAPVPAVLASSNGDSQQVALMALGSALLLGLCIVPPLVAAAGGRRQQQRRARWSAMTGDDEGPGGRL